MEEIIGLNEIKKCMARIQEQAAGAEHLLYKPPSFIINVSSGNGQTTITEYITEFLLDNRLREFHSRKPFLEYRIDGTFDQMIDVFYDISDNSVYVNRYSGVIAFDISSLSHLLHQDVTRVFFEKLDETTRDATVILYYKAQSSKSEELVQRVMKMTGFINIKVKPYTKQDLAKIAILNNLSSIDKEIEVEECYIDIMDEIERNRSVTAKQAVSLVGRSGLLCRTRDGAQKKKFKVL